MGLRHLRTKAQMPKRPTWETEGASEGRAPRSLDDAADGRAEVAAVGPTHASDAAQDEAQAAAGSQHNDRPSEPMATLPATGSTEELATLRRRLHQVLLSDFDHRGLSSLPPEEALPVVAEMARELIERDVPQTFRGSRSQLLQELIDDVLGFGPIEPLLRDPTVSEIMINGPYKVFAEREGRITLTGIQFADDAHVMAVLDRMLANTGGSIDQSSPMADTRLPDGSRVNAIIPPASTAGPIVTVRKFVANRLTADDLVESGALSVEAAALLRVAVESGANIVISGGTGAGKTTLLNVLSEWIPAEERIVTIEDPAELSLRQPNVIPLETRPAQAGPPITRADLLRNALRMRPDRIIVGEVRGAEAFDMLQAMNTGHDGSLTTVHANSPRDALRRIEQMVMTAGYDWPLDAVREQIASAIDLVIQISRLPDGSRRIVRISEVVGIEEHAITMQDLYVMDEQIDGDGKIGGVLRSTGLRPGVIDLPAQFWLAADGALDADVTP